MVIKRMIEYYNLSEVLRIEKYDFQNKKNWQMWAGNEIEEIEK